MTARLSQKERKVTASVILTTELSNSTTFTVYTFLVTVLHFRCLLLRSELPCDQNYPALPYLLSQQNSLALQFVGLCMMQNNSSCGFIQWCLHSVIESIKTTQYKAISIILTSSSSLIIIRLTILWTSFTGNSNICDNRSRLETHKGRLVYVHDVISSSSLQVCTCSTHLHMNVHIHKHNESAWPTELAPYIPQSVIRFTESEYESP